jgi:hypothetical protein
MPAPSSFRYNASRGPYILPPVLARIIANIKSNRRGVSRGAFLAGKDVVVSVVMEISWMELYD